jgi:hypothetical protein
MLMIKIYELADVFLLKREGGYKESCFDDTGFVQQTAERMARNLLATKRRLSLPE